MEKITLEMTVQELKQIFITLGLRAKNIKKRQPEKAAQLKELAERLAFDAADILAKGAN